ncbi:hypothetical protein DAI22_11g101400 [Oryza sativa Japonica Group]|nr:hypothetical protein DAI22_11g101400 [Oryza sativa Japonica Group]
MNILLFLEAIFLLPWLYRITSINFNKYSEIINTYSVPPPAPNHRATPPSTEPVPPHHPPNRPHHPAVFSPPPKKSGFLILLRLLRIHAPPPPSFPRAAALGSVLNRRWPTAVRCASSPASPASSAPLSASPDPLPPAPPLGLASTGRGVRGRQQGYWRRRPTVDWLRRLPPDPVLPSQRLPPSPFPSSRVLGQRQGQGQPAGLQLKAR